MRVLALDTATEACSAAVLTTSGMVGRFSEVGRGHAEKILDMVDAVLAEAGVSLRSLDGIAASIGPGSFTGVRISVAAAQGLAFGAGLPIVGVTTLEALALPALRGGCNRVMACLDARMGEVYWACFCADATRGLIACGPPSISVPTAVAAPFAGPFAGVGRGFTAYPSLRELSGLIDAPEGFAALPDAREMARLGALRLQAGEGCDAADLTPLYLRDKVAFTQAERAAGRL